MTAVHYAHASACVPNGRVSADFDLELEVLATIPPASHARIKPLALDFAVSMDEMKNIVMSLVKRFSIVLLPSSDGNGKVMVPKHRKSEVNAICLNYWMQVHHA